jgi:hypothetical protein
MQTTRNVLKHRLIPVALVLSLTIACRIPDLKPFSDATMEMATVLKEGFERARGALTAAAETAGDQDAFTKQVRELDDHWTPTRKALSALVAYSDSLTALAEAGKKGPETMAKLTGAVKELGDAVGLIPLGGTATKVVELVGAKIIEMQAERDIRKAVGKAAEAVDIVAPVLKDNFTDLRRIHGAASRSWEARVLEQSSILRNYYESLTADEQRLQYVLNLIIDYGSSPARLRMRAALARAKGDQAGAARLEAGIAQDQADLLRRLKESDAGFAAMNLGTNDVTTKVEGRQQELMTLIAARRNEIGVLEAKYQQATVDLNKLRDARATGDRVLQKGADAIGAWQKAHHSLQATAEGQQSRPSISDLLSIVKEISALLK